MSSKLLVIISRARATKVKVIEFASTGDCFACKAISDRDGISKNLERLGVRVECVGSIISDFIKGGYAPMVW